jgi:ATP-dependent Lhr-like helicase
LLEKPGVAIYVSPLKALINDQWSRLERLCELLEIGVYPWHGDIPASGKQRFLKKPEGVVLITPESLESLLINHGNRLSVIADALAYVAVDELHAFIGTERGKQLQSLLRRIEVAAKRRLPRIALSATLGEMHLAAEFLRPNDGTSVEVIESKGEGQELKLIIKGYLDSPPRISAQEEVRPEKDDHQSAELEDVVSGGDLAVGEDLFRELRGKNNLVFPNSRRKVELFADLLRRQCERAALPNEFWPHHGSLSREIRELTEETLKKGDRPATAICTTTLELGIDIGSVHSVAQIGPSPSVASLRQRLGRSGRRGGPAILRCYCVEDEISGSNPISDQLREGLVQTIATVNLLLERWYEPPMTSGLHLSTLIQQILSLIAQYGGIRAQNAYSMLCMDGPFSLPKDAFVALLRAMGDREILMQTDDGLLLHGALGEKLVNHYTFYAAFVTEEEYRIVTQGRTLGTLPISHPQTEGSFIIFAGRRWSVTSVDAREKVITVVPAPAGKPPTFGGGAGIVHDRIREEMRKILVSADQPPFLNKQATVLLGEARTAFHRYRLDALRVIQDGANVQLFPWRGDIVHNTITLMLRQRSFRAANEGLSITVLGSDRSNVLDALGEIAEDARVTAFALAKSVRTKMREKWDWVLSEELLCEDYAASMLDVKSARTACRNLIEPN